MSDHLQRGSNLTKIAHLQKSRVWLVQCPVHSQSLVWYLADHLWSKLVQVSSELKKSLAALSSSAWDSFFISCIITSVFSDGRLCCLFQGVDQHKSRWKRGNGCTGRLFLFIFVHWWCSGLQQWFTMSFRRLGRLWWISRYYHNWFSRFFHDFSVRFTIPTSQFIIIFSITRNIDCKIFIVYITFWISCLLPPKTDRLNLTPV